MKYILQEYLTGLKEDKELDAFCKELLISRGFIPLTKIQKGRQYGVDLAAVGTDEDGRRKLFLLVIKQGSLNRNNWNNGSPNDVKPSIDEVREFYIGKLIPQVFAHLPVKIIVCFNGEMDNSLQPNWTGYTDMYSGDNLDIDFWNIHYLVAQSLKYQIHEEFLPYDLALKFRKVLAFIDLPGYPLNHISELLQSLLPENETGLKDKQVYKKLQLINLCISIIHEWCAKANNLKPSFITIERVILHTYRWVYKNDYFKCKYSREIFYSILQNWRQYNLSYIDKISDFASVQDGLSFGIPSHNEYCLITFEQIGILSLTGLYEIWECSIANNPSNTEVNLLSRGAFSNAEGIASILARLIENNPSSVNPRFDEHCIEINMALILFWEVGYFGVAEEWLRKLVNRVIVNVKMANFLPLFNSDPEQIDVLKVKDQTSSHFIYFLAEWCIVLKQFDFYLALQELTKKDLQNIDLQLWLPDKSVEDYMFGKNDWEHTGATLTGLNLPKNYLELEMHMAEERELLNEESKHVYLKDEMRFLPFLSSRHYRIYPFPNSWRSRLFSNFCFNKAKEG
jgi:hypothetical protein